MAGWSQNTRASRYSVTAAANRPSLSCALASRNLASASRWLSGVTPTAHGRSPDVASASSPLGGSGAGCARTLLAVSARHSPAAMDLFMLSDPLRIVPPCIT